MSLWWGRTSASQQGGKLHWCGNADNGSQGSIPAPCWEHTAVTKSQPGHPQHSPAAGDGNDRAWLGSTGMPSSLLCPITYHKTNCHIFSLSLKPYPADYKILFILSHISNPGGVFTFVKKNLGLIFFSVLRTAAFHFIYIFISFSTWYAPMH